MASPSERLPGGLAHPLSAKVPQEPPDVRRQRGARAMSVAARLLAGASVFFFLSFLFAYFYLRSINQDNMWRPPHINPNQGLGAAFIVCVLLSAALTFLAGQRLKSESPGWVVPAAIAVVLGLAAIALQCIEYTVQHFGPTDGGYASVFVAWTGFYLVAVLATMYWLETQVATELRSRREGTEAPTGYEDPDKLLPRGFDAVVFYWLFLAGIGLITYVTLYLL